MNVDSKASAITRSASEHLQHDYRIDTSGSSNGQALSGVQKASSDANGLSTGDNARPGVYNASAAVYAGSSIATLAACSQYLSKQQSVLLATLPFALTTVVAATIALISL